MGGSHEIISEALRSDASTVQYHEYILLAVAGLIPLPYLFGSYQIRVGNESGSPSLIADGIQHKADVLTSSLVFLALIAQAFAMPLDRLASGSHCNRHCEGRLGHIGERHESASGCLSRRENVGKDSLLDNRGS